MKDLLRYAHRHIILVFLLGLLSAPTHVKALPHLNDTTYYKSYPYIIILDDDEPLPQLTDEQFFDQAACVVFTVNRWNLPQNNSALKELSERIIPQLNLDSLQLVKMIFRGTASPEGSVQKNKVLGERRVQTLYDYVISRMAFQPADSLLNIDTTIEDYASLCLLMRRANDPDYELVKGLVDEYTTGTPGDMPHYVSALNTLKAKLHAAQGGRLWIRLFNTYFPQLRTARFVMVLRKARPQAPVIPVIPVVPVVPVDSVAPLDTLPVVVPVVPVDSAAPAVPEKLPRRELFSVKTNVLLDLAYMPGYDRWCPIPNIAVEYYPLHGHFTYGASFDMPWWQHYNEHKFFQFRNYQLETRYYLKGATKVNYDERSLSPLTSHLSPLFTGFYLQAYTHLAIFGICFDVDRGWVGEGAGAGLGLGYVMPVSRNGHWRLELGLQAGFFRCKYDPYQYENPINPAYRDHLYYYKWTGKPELFKKRQYRWNWLGPTRVGITLTYDLLYRRIAKSGASFIPYEYSAAPAAPSAPAAPAAPAVSAAPAAPAVSAAPELSECPTVLPSAPAPERRKEGRP